MLNTCQHLTCYQFTNYMSTIDVTHMHRTVYSGWRMTAPRLAGLPEALRRRVNG